MIEIILTVTGCFVAIIVSIAGLFGGVGYYRQGKNAAKTGETTSANETVELFRNQAEGFKTDLANLHTAFESFKKEVTLKEDSYKKTISQQEDLIKTYSDILKNRNPELENILKEIRDFLKGFKNNTQVVTK